jgi:uridine kinase
MDSNVHAVTMAEADGMRIYRRSLTFLLDTAFSQIFPDGQLHIDHSVSSGGYYCHVKGRPPLNIEELGQIENCMRDYVAADQPFLRMEAPLQEAIAYFQDKGAEDKVRLLAHRSKDYVTIYQLDNHLDYHHGYMVPSTGYLEWFALTPINGGFTLRFPRRHDPTTLLPPPSYPTLLTTFRLYGNWLDRLGISSVGALNDAIQEKRSREVILVSEALHEQHVSEIAAKIAAHSDQIRIIFIAGPSSSGKTTFSKRLSVQLLARGVSPFPLEMDNYFVDRDKTPLDENGNYDFETVEALDREQLSSDVRRLIAGERVQLPHFDFITGQHEPGELVQISSDEIIILEGIHGLNPALLYGVEPRRTFRLYTSALTQLNLDSHNRISTTDTRLIRRIVRDARERGYSARQTINRWESVRRGEKRYIFPYQENANSMFNSALVYELSVLKPLVEPLLRQVPYSKPEYVEAKRLLALLAWFLPLETDLIPDNSILREFVGNSILREFKLWHNPINGG